MFVESPRPPPLPAPSPPPYPSPHVCELESSKQHTVALHWACGQATRLARDRTRVGPICVARRSVAANQVPGSKHGGLFRLAPLFLGGGGGGGGGVGGGGGGGHTAVVCRCWQHEGTQLLRQCVGQPLPDRPHALCSHGSHTHTAFTSGNECGVKHVDEKHPKQQQQHPTSPSSHWYSNTHTHARTLARTHRDKTKILVKHHTVSDTTSCTYCFCLSGILCFQ